MLERRAGTNPAGAQADSHGTGEEAPAPKTSLPCNLEEKLERGMAKETPVGVEFPQTIPPSRFTAAKRCKR